MTYHTPSPAADNARRPLAYIQHPSALTIPTRVWAVFGSAMGGLAVLSMCLAVLARVGGLS